MSRWGKPRKNKKRIDPRYFMDEKMEESRLNEAGEQVFAPGASDKEPGLAPDASHEAHPMMADVLKGLNIDQLAQAFWLEAARVQEDNLSPSPALERRGIVVPAGKLIEPKFLTQRAFRDNKKHMIEYAKNMGMVQAGNETELAFTAAVKKLNGDKNVEGSMLDQATAQFGSMASIRNIGHYLTQKAYVDDLKPLVLKDPISGDTFSFTPVRSTGGIALALQIN
tara:strand:- start:1240 stop:1911 length:672 start_codon:yes stop_codon:yes gene_type:complete